MSLITLAHYIHKAQEIRKMSLADAFHCFGGRMLTSFLAAYYKFLDD